MAGPAPKVAANAWNLNLRSGPQLREYQAMAARIVADRPALTLDWGCHWGYMTRLLSAAGLRVEAFDYGGDTAPNAEVPFELFPDLQAYVSSDPVGLPYEDDRFDAVLSSGVLEHVADPDASLEEIRRILRPGGTVYCYKLPNRLSYLEWVARHSGRHYHGQGAFDRLYTPRTARALFERHGYRVLELRLVNVLPLLLTAPWVQPASGAIWAANRLLSRVPLLNRLATNVELIARAEG